MNCGLFLKCYTKQSLQVLLGQSLNTIKIYFLFPSHLLSNLEFAHFIDFSAIESHTHTNNVYINLHRFFAFFCVLKAVGFDVYWAYYQSAKLACTKFFDRLLVRAFSAIAEIILRIWIHNTWGIRLKEAL